MRYYFIFAFLFFSFFVPHKILAATSVTGDIQSDTTWVLAGSPYIVENETYVLPGATLRIEPGVVVKLRRPFSALFVTGSMIAEGTSSSPIFFTSYRDDSVGGDTNGDGARSVPAPRDWDKVFVGSGGRVSLAYATIRYAGQFAPSAALYNNGGTVSSTGSTFSQSIVGVYAEGGTTTIQRSTFSDQSVGYYYVRGVTHISLNRFLNLSRYAFDNSFGRPIDARYNYWGSASGPFHATEHPTGTGGVIHGARVQFTPWIDFDPVLESARGVCFSNCRNPVIFIPGIMGTEFVRREVNGDEEVVWLDITKVAVSDQDYFMRYLSLDLVGNPLFDNVFATSVMRFKNILRTTIFNYTESLIGNLIAQGYQENTNLFFFPYDWRLSNAHTAQLLAARIDEVLAQTGATKVDIIAHSMGGLVVKEYIRTHETEPKIDKLLFLGTPHLGSPDAIKNLLFGGDLGLKYKDHSFLDRTRVKELARNMRSIYELLPTEQYLQSYGSVVSDLEQRKAYDHEETKSFFGEQHLNMFLVWGAESFHQNLDNFVLPDSIESYSIQGCGIPTIRRLVKQSPKFGEVEWLMHVGNGDSTVPLSSASFVSVPESHKITIPGLGHSEMPSDDLIQPLIISLLSGNTSTIQASVQASNHPDQCGLHGSLVSVHSPVAISATDSMGRYVGASVSGGVDLGIPGSMYEELDGNKFIFLPTNESGEPYIITLDGMATGTFNARVTRIVEDIPEETSIFIDIPVTSESVGSFTLPSGEEEFSPVLVYDEEGGGTSTNIIPDATTNEEDEGDFTPPTTTISISGTVGDHGWYKSVVTLVPSSVDDESGVLRTMYSVNGGSTWHVYATPLLVTGDGTHTLQYFSIDAIGNREDPREIRFSIDQTPPEAEFYFDSTIQDMRVQGTDVLSATTVSTTPTTYVVRDQAGNTLELVFKEVNRRILKRASLDRLVYNGQVILPNARLTSFVWLTNTRNEILSLQQALRYEVDEGLYALYTKLGNRTFIRERVNWNTFVDRFESGMRAFRFRTNNGSINYY